MDHDAIVIGTGFGGAVTAYRLAQSGIDTLVLERGKRWPIDRKKWRTFDRIFEPSSWTAWLSKEVQLPGSDSFLTKLGDYHKWRSYRPGIMEKIASDEIEVAVGAAVGGGSVVYGAMMLEPEAHMFPRIFERTGVSIDYDRIRPYYDRVRSIIGFGHSSEGWEENVINRDHKYRATRRFRRDLRHVIAEGVFADADFFRSHPVLSAADWSVIATEWSSKRKWSFISGDYVYGANSGAKNSLDHNYLKRAEGRDPAHPVARPVRIAAYRIVRRIEAIEGGYAVECEQIDDEGSRVALHTITARRVFACAGSMGTSLLMLRARHEGTLPDLGDEVGRWWGNNGDDLVVRARLRRLRAAHQGGPCTDGFLVEEKVDGRPYPVRIVHAPGPTYPFRLMHLGMSIPDSTGYLEYEPREEPTDEDGLREDRRIDSRLRIRWSETDAVGRRQMRRVMERFNDAARDLPYNLFGKVKTLRRRSTFHPLGGMALGKACDEIGRVRGYEGKGLYVIDGSLIPGHTACCNPAWTIAAISEWCIERILQQDFGIEPPAC